MDFVYSAFKRNEFISLVQEAKDQLQISTFGMIEFNAYPTDDRMEIANVQDSFIERLNPEQLEKLNSIK